MICGAKSLIFTASLGRRKENTPCFFTPSIGGVIGEAPVAIINLS